VAATIGAAHHNGEAVLNGLPSNGAQHNGAVRTTAPRRRRRRKRATQIEAPQNGTVPEPPPTEEP